MYAIIRDISMAMTLPCGCALDLASFKHNVPPSECMIVRHSGGSQHNLRDPSRIPAYTHPSDSEKLTCSALGFHRPIVRRPASELTRMSTVFDEKVRECRQSWVLNEKLCICAPVATSQMVTWSERSSATMCSSSAVNINSMSAWAKHMHNALRRNIEYAHSLVERARGNETAVG